MEIKTYYDNERVATSVATTDWMMIQQGSTAAAYTEMKRVSVETFLLPVKGAAYTAGTLASHETALASLTSVLTVDTVNSYLGVMQETPTYPLDVYNGANFAAADQTAFANFPQSSGHDPQQYLAWGQLKIYQAATNSLFIRPTTDNGVVAMGFRPSGSGRGAYTTYSSADHHYTDSGFALTNMGVSPANWWGGSSSEAYAVFSVSQDSSPDYPITKMYIGEDEGARLTEVNFIFGNAATNPLSILSTNIVALKGYVTMPTFHTDTTASTSNTATLWVSDGSGDNAAGDLMFSCNVAGTVTTLKLNEDVTTILGDISTALESINGEAI
jgi:hypothetical protein